MDNTKKFQEEDELGYRIDILGRNIEVTEPMRAHIWSKMSKIERFHAHIMHIQFTLELHRLEHSCTAVVKFDHIKIKVQANSSDMYASIDETIIKLQGLLSRYKSRIQDHHKRALSAIDMKVNVLQRDDLEDINADIEAYTAKEKVTAFRKPKVIGVETKPLKELTTDEAMMKIELSGDQFLIFRSEEDHKLKVIYRRTDGHYGLIQPE